VYKKESRDKSERVLKCRHILLYLLSKYVSDADSENIKIRRNNKNKMKKNVFQNSEVVLPRRFQVFYTSISNLLSFIHSIIFLTLYSIFFRIYSHIARPF